MHAVAAWRKGAVLGGLAGLLLAVILVLGGAVAPAYSDGTVSPSSFVIESEIYASLSGTGPTARCADAPASLEPGVTRCLVYRVHNALTHAISVRSISAELDPSFPAPPSGCSADKLSLPSFSGSFTVPAMGSARSPGLPIRLISTSTNQDDCKLSVLHFLFAGAAVYGQGDDSVGPRLAPTGSDGVVGALLVAGALAGAGMGLIAGRRRRKGARR